MTKTFKTLLLFTAAFFAVSSPVYANMTQAQFQQILLHNLALKEQQSLSNKGPSSQTDDGSKNTKTNAKTSKQSLVEFEKTLASNLPTNGQSDSEPKSLLAMSLGSENMGPTYPDFTNRGKVGTGDGVSVSAWSGMPTVSFPLIHVPGNDGLSLNLTYTSDDYSESEYLTQITNHQYVLHGDLLPGIISNVIPPNASFNFRDEFGHVHQFFYVGPLTNSNKQTIGTLYETRDHWKAKNVKIDQNLSTLTIESPDGKSYVTPLDDGMVHGPTPYLTIISAHGKDSVTYAQSNGANPTYVDITLKSSGYHVRVYGTSLYQYYTPITQSDGHTITLSQLLTFPDGGGHRYQYTPLTSSDVVQFSNSYKWTVTFNGHWEQPYSGPYNDYLSSVTSPYGMKTTLKLSTQQGPAVSCVSGGVLCRFGQFKVGSYTKSGPNAPGGTWTYSYATNQTQINGPVQNQLIKFVPQGGADIPVTHKVMVPIMNGGITFFVPSTSTTYQPQNHYVDGIVESEQDTDSKTGLPLTYTHYDYSFRAFGPTQFFGGDGHGNSVNVIPYQSEKTKITHGISEGDAAITDTYGFNDAGLETSESLGSLNGEPQSVTKVYFDKEYTDESGNSHYLITNTSTVTSGYSGVVDSTSSEVNDQGYTISSSHNGVTTSYTYGPTGDVATETNALGNTTTYTDYKAGFAQTQTDALGHVSRYTVNQDGTIANYTDPNGHETQYEYDYLGRVTKVTLPNADVYTNAYSLSGGEQVTTTTHGNAVQTTIDNAFGKPQSVTITAPDITTYTQTHQYDVIGRDIFTSYPGSSEGTATTYDGLSRVIGTDWPVSGPGQSGKYHSSTAYPSWDVIQHTDANGNEVDTTNYMVGSWDNSLGPVQIVVPLSGGQSQTTTITRDAMGRMLTVEQGGWTRTYHYNDNFWVSGIDNPETNTTQYTYDAIGEVLSSQVGASGVTKNTYDKIGELTNTTFPDGQVNTFTYTPTGKKTSASISGNGLPNSWSYTYDSLDNLKTATLTINGQTLAFSYDYNAQGFMSAAHYADGTQVDYAPDSLGRPTEGGSWVNHVDYMADGHEKSFTDASGVTTTYTLNDRHMVQGINFSSLANLSSGDNNVSLTYHYDGDTNITQVDDTRPNHNKSYEYNGASWLTSGTVDGKKVDISYDETGNITEKDYGDTQVAYTYDSQNRLQSVSGNISGALTGNPSNGTQPLSETFTYDNYGDVTSRDGNGTNFTYNDAKQLTHAMGTNPATGKGFNFKYFYDAMGNRVEVQDLSASTVHYEVYNGKQKLLYKTDGTNATNYIYLNGRKIAESTHMATTPGTPDASKFFHNDLQGSVVLESKPNGDIVDPKGNGQSYLPYGSELNPRIYKDTLTGEIGEHIGFINKPFNTETGLSYFGARYYDPLIGRFMGIDPEGFKAKSPITFNRFAYSNNNPTLYKDPDGCGPVLPRTVIAGALIGGVGADIGYAFTTSPSKWTGKGFAKNFGWGALTGAATTAVAEATTSVSAATRTYELFNTAKYGNITWGTAINTTVAGLSGSASNPLATTAGSLIGSYGEEALGSYLGGTRGQILSSGLGNTLYDYVSNKISSWSNSNSNSQLPSGADSNNSNFNSNISWQLDSSTNNQEFNIFGNKASNLTPSWEHHGHHDSSSTGHSSSASSSAS